MNKIFVVALVAIAGSGGLGWWWAKHDPLRETAVEHARKHADPTYTCPMHPEVKSDRPGNCPICGMTLVEAPPAAVAPEQAPADEKTAAESERRILYWYDPMRPDVHFDRPGKSPFMDMELLPKYADADNGGSVTIDPRVVQNLGVRTARVERGRYAQRVDTVGAIQADERAVTVVQARVPGWVERLHVRAVNDPVRRGQVLAEVYAPDLLAAQEELLLALAAGDAALADASRRRLAYLGVSAAQIERLERTRTATRTVAYEAPAAGVVAELNVREGQAVEAGTPMFRLLDLSRVWITAEIPEAQAGWIAAGQTAEARIASLPGQAFRGRVDYVYPELNRATRTLPVRLVFDNPQRRFKPGMFAQLTLTGGAEREALMMPTEALIRTGARSVAIVAESEGRFRPVAVTVGAEHEGHVEVLDGLAEGQAVVVSGQFLIDSEANLRSALGRMAGDDEPAAGTEPRP